MIYDSGDAEALRLVRAFYKIKDPEVRRIILAITEAAAGARLSASGKPMKSKSRRVDRLANEPPGAARGSSSPS